MFLYNASLFDTPNTNSYECKNTATFILDKIKFADNENSEEYEEYYGDVEDHPFKNTTAEIGSIRWQAFLPWDKTVTDFLDCKLSSFFYFCYIESLTFILVTAIQCSPNDLPISNAIPITVGAILLTMVSIVLIAYVVGRRRQAAQANEGVNYSQMES